MPHTSGTRGGGASRHRRTSSAAAAAAPFSFSRAMSYIQMREEAPMAIQKMLPRVTICAGAAASSAGGCYCSRHTAAAQLRMLQAAIGACSFKHLSTGVRAARRGGHTHPKCWQAEQARARKGRPSARPLVSHQTSRQPNEGPLIWHCASFSQGASSACLGCQAASEGSTSTSTSCCCEPKEPQACNRHVGRPGM